jgi:competence protein ComEA
MVIIGLLIIGGSLYFSSDSPAPLADASLPADNQDKEETVYVSGAVQKPGVFKIAAGSRILDAINIAGGFTSVADSSKLNLAKKIQDGIEINVPEQQSKETGELKSSGKVNINTASQSELDSLPGIGPTLAERIIKYRTDKGAFQQLDDLKKVSGIGTSKFNKLKDRITI